MLPCAEVTRFCNVISEPVCIKFSASVKHRLLMRAEDKSK